MCTRAAYVEERCGSAPSEAQHPHPGTQPREGRWGGESAGEQEAVRAVCTGLGQRDRRALLKNPCAISASLWPQ